MKMSKRTREGLMLSAVSLVVMFALLEVGTRMIAGIPLTDSRNFIAMKRILLKGTYPSEYDATLGWVPKAGTYEPEESIWHTQTTIGEYGIRANGRDAAVDVKPYPTILAVGDSFTFGDEVNDHETWPAQLEVISGVRVMNGGVFNYGFDQTTLRAQKLVDLFEPQILILGLIPDDIGRAELSVRGSTAKPYYEIINDNLVLKNVPPDPSRPKVEEMGPARRILGHSTFLDVVMNVAHLQPVWYGISTRDEQVHENGAGVSCKLLQRVGAASDEKEVTAVLLIQYLQPEIDRERREDVQTLLSCAQQDDMLVLDLYAPLKAIAETDKIRFEGFFDVHMTAAGNAFVAETVHEFLIANQLIGDGGLEIGD